MTDKLVVEIDSKDAELAVRNLDRLTDAAQQMGKAFENTRGATSALKELRLLLTGIKGKGSAFDELSAAVKNLNTTTDSLKASFQGSIGGLTIILKNEMAQLRAVVQQSGMSVGQAANKGIAEGMASTEGLVTQQIKASAAKNLALNTKYATDVNTARQQIEAKGTSTMLKSLEKRAESIRRMLETEGEMGLMVAKKTYGSDFVSVMQAGLAGQREVLAKHGETTLALRRSQNAQTILEMRKAAAAEQEILNKSQVKNATLQAVGDYSSVRSGRLFQVKNAELMMNMPSKADWEAATAKVVQQAKEAQLTAQAQVKNATLQAVGDYSSVRSGRLFQVKNAELMMNMPSKADWEAATAKVVQQAKEAQAKAQALVAAATNSPSGAYQKYNSNTMTAGSVVGPVVDAGKISQVNQLSSAFKQLTIDGNDAHSMARGLASGFNLLWLTWGNLVPLFVGAALSNGFMQTAKTGMQVADTFTTIAVLGGNTAQEMAALNAELDRLGNSGPQGPLAIAEAMKVLSLAGLKANEIVAVTQDVLNFSVAGTTDLKTAADTLVSVSTAFGMGAAGFGRVADVISKAAAESKTSVDSFASAMKTASVINAQYGVSLEDTATGIAALSQLGIEGTSAGTALRNMYADLSGRSTQVAKVLKAQGIEMRNATGEFRPMLEVVAELNAKFQTLDGISQKNLMQALLSERGAKGIVEMLRLINSEAKNMGSGMQNALQEMRAAIEESYGFAAISAAKMAQTAAKQFDAVKATLQTSMNTAYKEMEPTLLLIADSLRETFASPEFVDGLKAMVGLLANLGLSFVNFTAFVIENATAITVAATAYLGLRGVIAAKTAATAASTAATVADTAATIANNAAKAGAVGVLGTFARLLPGIGTAISLAAGAWMLYDFWQSKSKNTAQEASDLYNNNIIKNLEDEASRLKQLNDLRANGLSLTEAQSLLDARKASADAVAPATDKVTLAIRQEYAEVVKLNNIREQQRNYTTREGAFKVTAQERALAAAKSNTELAKREESETIKRTAEAQAKVVVERKRDADLLRQEAAARQAAFKSGTGSFEMGSVSDKKQRIDQIKVNNDNELREIARRGTAELALVQAQAANAQKVLDARHQAGLVSEGQYQAEIFAQIRASESEQVSLLESNKSKYLTALSSRAGLLGDALAKAIKLKDPEQIEKFVQEIENLSQTADTALSGMDNAMAKLADNGVTRLEVSSIKAQAAIKKLTDSEREFWKKDSDETTKLRTLADVEQKYKNLNESVFSLDTANKASALAGAEQAEKLNAKLAEMDYAYSVAESSALAFMSTNIMALASGDAEATKLYNNLRSIADAMQQARDEAGAKAETSIKDRALLAFEKARQSQIDALSNGLADAMETAIFEGGKTGGKKFIDVIRNELLKKPLRAIIQGEMQTLAGSIFGSAGGSSAGSGLSSLANLWSIGSKAVSGIGSFLGLGGAASTGLGLTASTGTGLTLASTGTGLGLSTGTGLGLSAGANTLGGTLGTTLTTTTATSGGLMGALGTAAPFIGAAMAIYAIAKSLDDSGTSHTGAGASYSMTGGLKQGAGTYNKDTFGMGMAEEWSQKTQDVVSGIASSIGTALDSTAKAFGKTAGYEIATAFADDTSKGGAWGSLRITQAGKDALNWSANPAREGIPKEFADSDEGYKQYLAAVAKDTRQVLLDMDLPTWADTILTNIGEAADMDKLAAAVAQIGEIQNVFVQLGKTIDGFAGMGDETFGILMRASGGIEALAQNANSYYDNFYSESERMAKATVAMTIELAKFGKELPKTKEDYRTLLEQQLKAGEGGAELAAVMLQLSPTFAQVADFAAKASEELNVLSETMASLQSDSLNLQIELLEAQGRESEAVAMRRTMETKGFNAAELAAYDYNARLRESITATNSASAALKAYKNAASSISTSKDTIAGVVRTPAEQAETAIGKALANLNTLLKPEPKLTSAGRSYLGDYADVFAAFLKDTAKGAAYEGLSRDAYAQLHYENYGKTEGRKDPLELKAMVITLASTFKSMSLEDVLNIDTSNQGKYTAEQWDAIAEVFSAKANSVTAVETPGSTVVPDDSADRLKAILEERKTLQERYDALTMTSIQMLEKQRNALDESNRALFDAVQMEERKAVVAAERKTLQEQYDSLTLSSTQLLARQRDALDESNRALFDNVQAAKAAAEQASIRASLDRQLLELQGNTAALRALEIAGMDDANVALYDRVQALTASNALAKINLGYQDQLDVLTGAQTDRSIALRDATDESTRAIMRQIYAQQDLKTALDDSVATSDKALSDIQKALGEQKTARTKAVDDVKAVFGTVSDAIKSLYGEVDATRAMQAYDGRSFIATAAALAKAGGGLPDQSALGDAIAAARGDTKQYASQADADFEKLVLAGQLQALADVAGPQLTEAEALLSATNDAYEVAKTQLETLRGIDSSVLSVAQAVEAFQVAFTGEQTARQKLAASAAQSASGSAGAYESTLSAQVSEAVRLLMEQGRAPAGLNDALMGTQDTDAGMRYSKTASDLFASLLEYKSASAVKAEGGFGLSDRTEFGMSLDDAIRQREIYNRLRFTSNIPQFDVGTNYVPRDMLAMVHKGEEIVPAPWNPAASGRSRNGNARLEALVEGLTKEVQALRAAAAQGAAHAETTAEVLLSVKNGSGLNMTTAPAF